MEGVERNKVRLLPHNPEWEKWIKQRNQKIEEGNGGSDFYVDEGLMQKLLSQFEEPSKEEIDVWYLNCQEEQV